MVRRILQSSVNAVPWSWRSRIKRLGPIASFQRWIVGRFLTGHEFLHTINAGPAKGLRYPVRLPEDKAVWTGGYETEFSAALSRAVRKGDVCLDVGGYRGFFSGVCAVAGASAVHTFEPLPENIARIRLLIEANPSLAIDLHPIALGAEVGQTDFVIMPEASMGKLSASIFQDQVGRGATLRVQIETLDHLRDTGVIPVPNLIKIDVEGAEAMVLRGAERLLREARPKLFIELHNRELARECQTLLAALGYSTRILETGSTPDFLAEPEVCHLAAEFDSSADVVRQL